MLENSQQFTYSYMYTMTVSTTEKVILGSFSPCTLLQRMSKAGDMNHSLKVLASVYFLQRKSAWIQMSKFKILCFSFFLSSDKKQFLYSVWY